MAHTMASVAMALPLTYTQNWLSQPKTEALIRPLHIRVSKKALSLKHRSRARVQVHSSLKDTAVTALTASALTASMVIPDVAEAAEYSFSPSLKNFLLSIAAGGVVLVAILGAVIGVSNFDPVKRS